MKNIGVGGGQARTRRGFPRLELALLQDADRAGLMNTGLAKIKRCKGSATMKRRGFCVETPNPRNANSHIFHVRVNLFRIDPWGGLFPRGAGSRNSAEGGKREQCE